jgi:iron complex outermembrane receptor protein
MTRGNISMLVCETGGLRVQVTSPALGASNVRVRGLEGRYTQISSDGLPLYGQTSSIGCCRSPRPTLAGGGDQGCGISPVRPSALGGT